MLHAVSPEYIVNKDKLKANYGTLCLNYLTTKQKMFTKEKKRKKSLTHFLLVYLTPEYDG